MTRKGLDRGIQRVGGWKALWCTRPSAGSSVLLTPLATEVSDQDTLRSRF